MAASTPFQSFARLCATLEATRSRNQKIRLISDFISSLEPAEIGVAVRFLTGRVFGEQDAKKLGVGGATLWRLAKADSLQTPLLLSDMKVSLLDVGRAFDSLASLSGKDRQQRAENLLHGLFSRFSESERGIHIPVNLWRDGGWCSRWGSACCNLGLFEAEPR